MAKKATGAKKKAAKTPAGTRPFVADANPAGGFRYFDQAGRVYKGFSTEEEAQAAADEHVPLQNDPTLNEKPAKKAKTGATKAKAAPKGKK